MWRRSLAAASRRRIRPTPLLFRWRAFLHRSIGYSLYPSLLQHSRAEWVPFIFRFCPLIGHTQSLSPSLPLPRATSCSCAIKARCRRCGGSDETLDAADGDALEAPSPLLRRPANNAVSPSPLRLSQLQHQSELRASAALLSLLLRLPSTLHLSSLYPSPILQMMVMVAMTARTFLLALTLPLAKS